MGKFLIKLIYFFGYQKNMEYRFDYRILEPSELAIEWTNDKEDDKIPINLSWNYIIQIDRGIFKDVFICFSIEDLIKNGGNFSFYVSGNSGAIEYWGEKLFNKQLQSIVKDMLKRFIEK